MEISEYSMKFVEIRKFFKDILVFVSYSIFDLRRRSQT